MPVGRDFSVDVGSRGVPVALSVANIREGDFEVGDSGVFECLGELAEVCEGGTYFDVSGLVEGVKRVLSVGVFNCLCIRLLFERIDA